MGEAKSRSLASERRSAGGPHAARNPSSTPRPFRTRIRVPSTLR